VVVLEPGVVAVVYDPFTGSLSGPHIGPSVFLKAPWQGVVRGSCGVGVVELSGRSGSAPGPVAARTRDGVEVWVDISECRGSVQATPNVAVNPLPILPGGSATILLSVSKSGKCGATVFIPGQSIEVRLRTASGAEYVKLVVLP